jgi:hypothetical protein
VKEGAKLWSDDDDTALRREVQAGTKLDDIATKIGRTPSAIRNRAYILRLTLGKPRMQQRLPKKEPGREDR